MPLSAAVQHAMTRRTPAIDRRAGRARVAVLLAAFVSTTSLASPPARAQSYPPPRPSHVFRLPEGFVQQTIVTGLNAAAGMAVAPDGRIFICDQTGALRVVKDNQLLDQPFVALEVDSYWERGLIGVELDPRFAENGFVYLLYVASRPYPHHRLSRFTAQGDRAAPDSELMLLEGDDQNQLGGAVPAGHQGGGLRFGADGMLYVGIGEQTAVEASQRLDTFQGKLLRIRPDGGIPPDNPFYNSAHGKYRAIWAHGLRNPFGLAVQPGTGSLYINDVGGSLWEEINVGQAGANYGWPENEGYTTNPKHRGPVHAYRDQGKNSITGGVFFPADGGAFPPAYEGKYLFADFEQGELRLFDPQRPDQVETFASGLPDPVAMALGPDGALYCLNRDAWVRDAKFQPNRGSLVRIRHAGPAEPRAPRITIAPTDLTAVLGEAAEFRIEAEGEGPLQFSWRKYDRWIARAEQPTLTLDKVRVTDDGAAYECVVWNRHGVVLSRPAMLWVTSPRPAVADVPLLPGLEYELRAGQLPARNAFTPTGIADGFTLSSPPTSGPLSVSWRGYLEVDRAGAYTFRVTSDDGAKLFVAGAETASIGPYNGPRAATGAVGLAAGKHAIRFDAALADPAAAWSLSYSGPGLSNGPIPAAKLFRIDRSVAAAPSITPAGGSFTGPVRAALTSSTADAEIRYSLDGRPPTHASPLYDGEFTVARSAVLTAAIIRPGESRPLATSRSPFTIEGDRPFGLSRRRTAVTLNVPDRADDLPRLLSQTGLFRSLADLTPAEGVIPYGVNSPLWSDGALKRRWLALRGDARIGFNTFANWEFPAGTVFVKHFELGDPAGAQRRRLETRLLVVDRTGAGYGATYRWRDDQQDAELLDEGLTEEVAYSTADGPRRQTWSYPSRRECLLCHTSHAGFVLGANTRQLNGDFHFPALDVVDNQLRVWSHAGLFERTIADEELPQYPRLASLTDESASLGERARSYLDANCSQCHRPGGVRVAFNARFETPLDDRHLVESPLEAADLGVAGARLLAPGDRERSMIHERMRRRQDVFNMPPLATHQVDAEALEIIGRWIDSLARGQSR